MADTPVLDPNLIREVGASCVCMRVQRAGRAIGRRFDQAFRDLKLNNWQFTLLMWLASTEAPSVNDMATQMAMDRTTMTRNLRVLERRGLLAIQPDTRDGRVKRVALTDPGRSLLAQAAQRWRATNEAVKRDIPAAALPGMWEALDAIAPT